MLESERRAAAPTETRRQAPPAARCRCSVGVHAALVPVVEAAGGCITDWQGNALTIESEGEIVATSGPRLHESALEVLSSAPPSTRPEGVTSLYHPG